nr:hypothetical protein GCM10020093_017740 [Planobispora longispora]
MLWQIMSVSIMILWLSQLALAVAAARRPIPDRTAARGIRLGLAVSLLGMLVAFPMTMPFQAASDVITGAHSVGVPDGGPGLPVTGWSTTGGDLRVAHFVGLHALQALPLLAWWLTGRAGRVARLDEATRGRLLAVAAVSYSVLVGTDLAGPARPAAAASRRPDPRRAGRAGRGDRGRRRGRAPGGTAARPGGAPGAPGAPRGRRGGPVTAAAAHPARRRASASA